MILRRLQISGFGGVSGEITFDTEKINLLVGPNESGKSTVAAAIAAALYGLDEDRRGYRGRLTPRDQFEPWDGKPYAIELAFEVGSERYTVNRHFGRQKVTVYREGTGDVTEEFRTGPNEYSIGEMLLGVNVDQFVRSALWLQPGPGRFAGGEVRPDDQLSSLLERQASSVSGDASAQAALDVLENALRQYPVGDTKILVSTQIRRLTQQIETLQEELTKEEKRIERAALALDELRQAREIETKLEAEKDHVAYRAERATRTEKQAVLQRNVEARESLDKLEKEHEHLSQVPTIDRETADSLRRARVQLEEAERSLADLEAERKREVEEPMAELQSERDATSQYEWARPVHRTELDDLIREHERLADGQSQAEAKRTLVQKELEKAGIDFRRHEARSERFAALSPSDSEALSQYPASAQASATERVRADEEADEALGIMNQIGSERTRRRVMGGGILAIGIGAIALSIWLALQGQVTFSFGGLAVALIGISVGTVFLIRGSTHRAEERKNALRRLTDARRKQQGLREKTAERELALSDITAKLNFSSNEELLTEHSEFLRADRETDRLTWVDQDIESLAREESQLSERGWRWLARVRGESAAEQPPEDWQMVRELEAIRSGMDRRLAIHDKLERFREIERRFEARKTEAEARRKRASEVAEEVVTSLGTPRGDWETAFQELDARRRAQERLEEMDRTMREFRRQLLEPTEADSLQREVERITTELEKWEKEHPEWAHESDSERAAAPSRRESELALSEATERRFQLEKEIGRIEEETRGGGRASEIRLELAELEHEKSRAERYQDAVQLAAQQLKKVARETHAMWSEFLSRRVGELLSELGPSYRGFEVTDTLEYSLVVEGQRWNRTELEQVLSAGALDQLALALRVAVCEYLSRGGEPLPLLLDDPYATGDDSRAENGLRFLSRSVRDQHQILLMTCHRLRIEETRRNDPEWFEEHVRLIEMPLVAKDPGNKNGAAENGTGSEVVQTELGES